MVVVNGVASLFYQRAKKGRDRKDVSLSCERLQLFLRSLLVVVEEELLLPVHHSVVGMLRQAWWCGCGSPRSSYRG
jgi:hypothetical protein